MAKTNKSFTLAEVLITLGIIGVVMTMTIPTLIQKKTESETVAKLQKVYSTLTNAFNLVVKDNGTPDQWGTGADVGATSKIFLDNLAANMKLIKNCGTGTGCFPPGIKYKRLEGGYDNDAIPYDSYDSGSHLLLSDGTAIQLIYTSPATTSDRYAVIMVDINGSNGPNQWGVDVFNFIMWQNKIIPAGAQTGGFYSFPYFCDKSYDPNNTTQTRNGSGCAAWVIYNNNMDYRYCTGLSWNGPTKCP